MRETVRSLRFYFILSGLASLWFGLGGLVANLRAGMSAATILAIMIGIASAALALSFLYVGMFLGRILQNSSSSIVTLLYLSAGLAILTSLLSLLSGGGMGAIAILAITLLILWYLLRNVRRLVAEAQPPASTAIGE